jgi:hypothetical protein
MINDPDQRAEFEADVAAVADALPALDPALRKVMAGFFELVGHQIDEVERIQQRCAQRVKRFTAFGTMEQSRGVARQLNEAIGSGRALLKSSFTDSRSANPPTVGAVAATSCNPRVVSCAAPTNAAVHPAVANAMAIRSRGASRSAGEESSNVNGAMMKPAIRVVELRLLRARRQDAQESRVWKRQAQIPGVVGTPAYGSQHGQIAGYNDLREQVD